MRRGFSQEVVSIFLSDIGHELLACPWTEQGDERARGLKATLASCALVSKSWRLVVTPLLFKLITLGGDRKERCASLQKLLKANSSLKGYVHGLRFAFDDTDVQKVEVTTIRTLFRSLRPLERLELRFEKSSQPMRAIWDDLTKVVGKSLSVLHFDAPFFHFNLLEHMPRLKHLSFSRCQSYTLGKDGFNPTDWTYSGFKLCSLRLFDAHDMIGSLLELDEKADGEMFNELEVLDFEGGSEDSPDAFVNVAEAASSSLQTLRIMQTMDVWQRKLFSSVIILSTEAFLSIVRRSGYKLPTALGPFPQLKHLELDIHHIEFLPLDGPKHDQKDAWNTTFPNYAQHFPSLESIRLHLVTSSKDPLDNEDMPRQGWLALSYLLSAPVCPNLAHTMINFKVDLGRKKGGGEIYRSMPDAGDVENCIPGLFDEGMDGSREVDVDVKCGLERLEREEYGYGYGCL